MARRFEVFRMEKLKDEAAVVRAVRHDLDLSYQNEKGEIVHYRRTRDAELEHKNRYMHEQGKAKQSKEERFQYAMKSFREKLPPKEKRRKNAVLGAQCIFSFSHELLQDPEFKVSDFFTECQKFVHEHFGKENVFCWAAHFDEKTPHITFQFVPKIGEKLNARAIFGNKSKLSEWQDKFHNEVGAKFGLERGIKRAYASRDTLQRFYGQIQQIDDNLSQFQPPSKKPLESQEAYNERLRASMKEYLEPMLKPLTSMENEIKRLEKRLENSIQAKKDVAKEKQKEIDELKKIIDYEPKNVTETPGLKQQLAQKQEQLNNWLKMSPEELRKKAAAREIKSRNNSMGRNQG